MAVTSPAVVTLADLFNAIQELRGEVREMGRRLDRPRPTLSRADRDLLGKLLPAIGGALGSEPFVCRELLEHDSGALRLVLRDLNATQIGRLLRRGAGQVIDRYVVERAGTELHVGLWRVLLAPE